jgi:hypothetical protein
MRQLFITKGVIAYGLSTAGGTIAGGNVINLLADGAIAALHADGSLVDGTTPAITESSVYFALGRTSLGALVSPLIDTASMAYKKTAYSAPVAEVMAVGNVVAGATTYSLNLPSQPVAGTVATLTVVDETKPFYDRTRAYTYEYRVVASSSPAIVQAGLIAKINAHAGRVVNAAEVDSTNHNGFKLTAITAGKKFNIYCGGILSSADVLGYNEVVVAGTPGISATTTVVVANRVGTGLATEIALMEQDYSTEYGNIGLQDRGVSMFTSPARTVAGATYTQYFITWTKPNDNPLIPKANMTQLLVIAVVSTDSVLIGILDTILAAM